MSYATYLQKMATYSRTDDVGLLTLVSPATTIGANSTTPASVAIGFTFSFDGSDYTSVELSPAGWARFGGAAGSADNADLFVISTSVIAAPWWDAMKTAETTGYVKTETQGTAPWRRFIAEWLCYSSSADTAANNDLLRFQAVLYETTARVEFRRAARVRTGTPTAATASVGLRGNGVAARYRDMAVDDQTLGASATTTTTNLTATSYDALVGIRQVAEPNWPMCGRAHMIDPEAVTGLNVYDDVLWKIANFVNWYWCAHTPALVNFAPYQQTGTTPVTYVVPVEPSDEGLDYTFYMQVYASTGATCTVSVDENAVANPDPSGVPAAGDWSNVTAPAVAVSTGWNELAVMTGTLAAATTHLRFSYVMSAGSVIVGSVVAVPTALTDVDETYTSATGFVPMSIRALRVQGAGVYAEWYNRAWKNLAYIANDRRQAVWSSVWQEESVTTISATTERPVRTIGVSKGAIPGFRGQAAKARIYARDSVADSLLQLSEQGNGLLAEWTVGTHAGKYSTQTTNIALVSDEPLITATVNPGGATSPMAVLVDWAPGWSTGDLFLGVTPAPRLSLLLALVRRMDKALRCYAYAGNATMLARGKTSSSKWHLQAWVGPAVKALRPKIARDSDDQDHSSAESLIYATSSGSGANDEITVPSPHTRGRDDYPPEGTIAIGAGGELYDAAPGASVARLLESPTATSMTGGARERIEVLRGVGITFVPVKADPLSL